MSGPLGWKTLATVVLGLVLTTTGNHAARTSAPPVNPHAAHMMAPPAIPDLCPEGSADKVADASGDWSDTNTWAGGVKPVAGDNVWIESGVAVVYDEDTTTEYGCIGGDGTLQFDHTVDTELHYTNIYFATGHLTVGTLANPIGAGVTATLVTNDVAPDTGTVGALGEDPEQYGTGIIIRGTASITVHGQARTNVVRLTDDPEIGQDTLHLTNGPGGWEANWAVGDTLLIPDTSVLDNSPGNGRGITYTSDYEECVIEAIDTSANTVTCVDTFVYNHLGSRVMGASTSEFYPHVANITRNVIFNSENPSGTRGHMLFTERAEVEMFYFLSTNMGRTKSRDPVNDYTDCTRNLATGTNDGKVCTFGSGTADYIGTNQSGRYAVHMHHLTGPESPMPSGRQFDVEGAAITHTRKWGIAVHNSHWGDIKNNVVYDAEGAAYMTEDGSERENVFDGNVAWLQYGFGGRQGGGREATGFYFRGPDNTVTNNIAGGAVRTDADPDANYGFKYFMEQLGLVCRPTTQGSTSTDCGVWPPRDLAIRSFDGNETYGASESGMTIWWSGCCGSGRSLSDAPPSTLSNFRAWAYYNNGIFQYETRGLTMENFTFRGGTRGLWIGDYQAVNNVIDGWDVKGAETGLDISTNCEDTTNIVRDSTLQNTINIRAPVLYTSAAGADSILSCIYEFRDNTYLDPPGGGDLVVISMEYGAGRPPSVAIHGVQLQVFYFYGYGGQDYRVFFQEQASTYEVVQTYNYDGDVWPDCSQLPSPPFPAETCSRSYIGSPDAGLTNAENWALYGIAIAGAIATCDDTLPEFDDAFVCALSAEAVTRTLRVPFRIRLPEWWPFSR